LAGLSSNRVIAPSCGANAGRPEELGRSWAGGTRLEALANLAHELRTPVQVLLGYIEILRDDMGQALAGEPGRIVERMNSNVHDLARTVENLLEFALAEAYAEPVDEENVDLADLLDEVAPAIEAANRCKGLEIRVELDAAPELIRSRRRPIRTILTNLALNAVKFTSAGRVTITVRESVVGGNEGIELEIRDTGPGIRPEMVDHAFERFSQLSCSSARRYRGVGLGLPVVQRNVRALGGTLAVETAPGKGSCFRVAVPCNIVRRKLTQARPHAPGSSLAAPLPSLPSLPLDAPAQLAHVNRV
jgi:signal transduction histidine kinase